VRTNNKEVFTLKTVLVLGVGLQGKILLYDLERSPLISTIVAADQDIEGLRRYVHDMGFKKVREEELDARNEDHVASLMKAADIVIEMLPGVFSLPMARLAVENNVSLVNAMYLLNVAETDAAKRSAQEVEVSQLHKDAVNRGVTILPEMGMDPGIDLVLCGQAVRDLDEVQELYSYGSGFPEFQAANNPLKYKISWSFDGVLKSYRRPGRILRDGRIVEIPAREMFSEAYTHTVEMPGLGQFDAFANGDATKYAKILGILGTVRTMGRFVLRWDGHCAFWDKIVKLGFLDDAPVTVGGSSVVPREFVYHLLEPQLHYGSGERDIAHIRVDVRGIKDGKRKRVIYQVLDRRDLDTGFTAMTRTVAFTASIGAQMILRSDIDRKGVLSPAADVPFSIFSMELKKRGIQVERSEESWTAKN
jgi:saccharopine dehydrogenase-like NADP-dependent oxidoreductase